MVKEQRAKTSVRGEAHYLLWRQELSILFCFALGAQDLTLDRRPVSDSQQSSCLRLQRAKITGVSNLARLRGFEVFLFFKKQTSWALLYLETEHDDIETYTQTASASSGCKSRGTPGTEFWELLVLPYANHLAF